MIQSIFEDSQSLGGAEPLSNSTARKPVRDASPEISSAALPKDSATIERGVSGVA